MHFLNTARVFATAAFGLLSICCLAQTLRPDFGRQEAVRRIDSVTRRLEMEGSPVASNKRYSELSPEEKASINQYYEMMEPGDEPPYPRDGLKPIYDVIEDGQRKLLVSGELILLATVSATGTVTEVKAIGSPSQEMTKFAASVLLLTQFKPALCQGQPCKMEYPFRVVFSVR